MTALNRLSWLEQKKIAAWTACDPIDGLDPAEWRWDAFGISIRRTDHGKQTEYGWEIDHVIPLALGGPDTLDNLRALHWRKNRGLGGVLGNALKPSGPLNLLSNALARPKLRG